MSELRIEDGEHPAFELLPARHRERHRGRRVASHAGHDIEQMLGVVRRARAARQCEIVTGALALGAKLLCRGPHQWVKPVDGAGETAHRVSDEIVPAHVRELVQKHRATAVERPCVALCGKYYGRTEQPACKRHLCIFTAKKARWLFEREPVRYFPERSEPVFS